MHECMHVWAAVESIESASHTHTHTIEICLYGTVYCKSTALQCKLTDVVIKSNIVQVQLTVFIVYEFLTHSSS